MNATGLQAARPKFWTRRRVAAWSAAAVLLAACAAALRDRLRAERLVATIERVGRLGGHVDLGREHADWQWPLVRRLPALHDVLGRESATVELRNAALSPDDLRAVAAIPGLRGLDLADATGVDDQCLEVLGGATELVNLDLSGTGVTDRGAERLADLARLNAIGLDDTRVTDAAVDALKRRPAVAKAVRVRGAGVTSVAGEGITISRPVRAGGPVTVAGRAFIRELPPGGRAVLTAMILRPGQRDGQDIGRMALAPQPGWQNFTLAAAVPAREPEGRFAVEVDVYVGGPPFVIYRVARFAVDVLPDTPTANE